MVKEALDWELLGLIVVEGSSTRRSSYGHHETPTTMVRGIDMALIASGSFSSYPSKPLAMRKSSASPTVLLSIRSFGSASATVSDSVRSGHLTRVVVNLWGICRGKVCNSWGAVSTS